MREFESALRNCFSLWDNFKHNLHFIVNWPAKSSSNEKLNFSHLMKMIKGFEKNLKNNAQTRRKGHVSAAKNFSLLKLVTYFAALKFCQ